MNLEELQSLYDFTSRSELVIGGAGVLCVPKASEMLL